MIIKISADSSKAFNTNRAEFSEAKHKTTTAEFTVSCMACKKRRKKILFLARLFITWYAPVYSTEHQLFQGGLKKKPKKYRYGLLHKKYEGTTITKEVEEKNPEEKKFTVM